jgi:hypothetical protein
MATSITYTATVSAAPAGGPSSTDLIDEIAANAAGPSEVRGDSGSVRQHPLRDQIEAHRFLAAQSAVADSTRKTFGIRFGQLVAPGAQGGES